MFRKRKRALRTSLPAVPAGREQYDTERAQAMVRIILTPLFGSYITAITFLDGFQSTSLNAVAAYFAAYMPVSFFLYWWIIRKPGAFIRRRALSMGGDYTTITFGMSIGGAALLPVYSALLWVTVGNGLRFGVRYLVVSTLLALLSLAVTTYFMLFGTT